MLPARGETQAAAAACVAEAAAADYHAAAVAVAATKSVKLVRFVLQYVNTALGVFSVFLTGSLFARVSVFKRLLSLERCCCSWCFLRSACTAGCAGFQCMTVASGS